LLKDAFSYNIMELPTQVLVASKIHIFVHPKTS
jgi:hypothetical protein